jgi:hypothetical protein
MPDKPTTAEAAMYDAETSELRRQLTNAIKNNHERNLALDALHYVWCDGGCESGIHRWGEHPPLTQEIMDAAEASMVRLRRYFQNMKARQSRALSVEKGEHGPEV